MTNQLIRTLAAALSISAGATALAVEEAKTPLAFKPQDLDTSLTVGYAVRVADINGDGKPDILVCDSARVIWFSNGDWKLHTIIENKAAGVKADNVCIDTYDIDGDGKLDVALGADWLPNNTTGAGSLQWLKQPANVDDPWTVHKIADSIPTLHRIHFGDLDGDGRKELLVGPLKGVGSTAAAAWGDKAVHLTAYPMPADPVKGSWVPAVVNDQFHVMHNFLPVQWGLSKGQQILTASYEGVHLLTPDAGGKYAAWKLGEGSTERPDKNRGSSEIKFGKLKDGRMILATTEPFHGNEAVVYVQPGPVAADKPWPRTLLDDTLTAGHAVGVGDLDGDGNDELVIGWRDVIAGKPPVGIKIFRAAETPAGKPVTWTTQQLEKGGVACEDLVLADLNGDGKLDVVAVGRKTKNVRVYWNETPQAKK